MAAAMMPRHCTPSQSHQNITEITETQLCLLQFNALADQYIRNQGSRYRAQSVFQSGMAPSMMQSH